MKIILRRDIEKLGKSGEIVNVKDGFARNYLFPREFAFVATPSAIRRVESANKSKEVSNDKIMQDAMILSEQLSSLQLQIPMKVGDANQLYASVNTNMIASKLAELGFTTIEKGNIILEETIKTLGLFDVKVKILADVVSTIKVWVVAEGNDNTPSVNDANDTDESTITTDTATE